MHHPAISRSFLLLPIVTFLCILISANAQDKNYKEIEFKSLDGITITADLYTSDDNSKPFILLCHQAGWSRGEYREIAPKLNALGFNCLAIDQRSGGAINSVSNATAVRAKAAKKPVNYVDAEQDIIAAMQYAKNHYAKGKLILWGSSYSSSLVLYIASKHTDTVDATLSFAPGEYFKNQNKSATWITESVKNIKCPTFITSAKNEANSWSGIHKAIPTQTKVSFLPTTKGNHGARALWEKFNDSEQYWQATKKFLEQFN